MLGHVDHGKTALVRALTGIETDRLEEERERGLSIVLGFSYLETARGVIDLIDVPGHEDFVRAMISGATGLDGVVLVVAANEGVMPQTREHLEITGLLGLHCGIVALTKADLVDASGMAAATAEVQSLISGTFLDGAPIVGVCAPSGEGIETLTRRLDELAGVPLTRGPDRGCYLPLDRVFTKRGFGLVGTGTLRGGVLRAGAALEILPAGIGTTVRGLQSRNRAIDVAEPGQRVAVNLRNVDLEQVRRGDTLATPGLLTPTRRVDVRLELIARENGPLKNGARVRVLLGTSETLAKVRLLDTAELAPGTSAFAQLRLEQPIATQTSERFIVRSYSPMRTIGGGEILEVDPERHRRFDVEALERLATVAGGDLAEIARRLLADAGAEGIANDVLSERVGLAPEAFATFAASMDAIEVDGARLVARSSFRELSDCLVAAVDRYHAENPQSRGIAAGALERRLEQSIDEAVFRHAVRALAEAGELERHGEIIARTGFDPFADLAPRERDLADEIEQAVLAGGVIARPLAEIAGGRADKRRLVQLLVEMGRLVRLRTYDRAADLVLHEQTLRSVKLRLEERYPHPRKFAVKDARDMLGSTRKHVVPIMEHLDATGFTVRLGDFRQLRER